MCNNIARGSESFNPHALAVCSYRETYKKGDGIKLRYKAGHIYSFIMYGSLQGNSIPKQHATRVDCNSSTHIQEVVEINEQKDIHLINTSMEPSKGKYVRQSDHSSVTALMHQYSTEVQSNAWSLYHYHALISPGNLHLPIECLDIRQPDRHAL